MLRSACDTYAREWTFNQVAARFADVVRATLAGTSTVAGARDR